MIALDDWTEEEASFAVTAMLRAVSATQTIKERPGFGQRVVPRPGSVLASPVPAAYDPDPDYFFHWFRDSAIIIDALRVARAEGLVDATSIERLREFVDFNRALRKLDGREFLRQEHFRKKVQPSFLQYVRPDAEIAAVYGDAVQAEARVNPDGTLDFTRWARPQNDGPALQVLALTRWRDARPDLDRHLRAAMLELAISDLDFIRAHAIERSFDIWEEESGYHYYTQLVQAEALARGAEWLDEAGDASQARNCRSVAGELDASLGAYWSAADGYYRSRIGVIGGGAPSKALDISVILGVLHAGRMAGTHSVLDPRAQATLAAVEDLFDAEYALNHQRPPDRGPAIGRYANDAYYGGNPWYLATLAAAEFYFKLANVLQSGAELAVTGDNARFRERLGVESPTKAAFEHGKRFMRTVQAYTPPSGELSEQFDRATGAQTSAKHLAWSYAAFITAAASRRQAARAIRG
ncbi:MAG TPA: glycoside hydrolase family 15 protein [Roseiarcus sp.]